MLLARRPRPRPACAGASRPRASLVFAKVESLSGACLLLVRCPPPLVLSLVLKEETRPLVKWVVAKKHEERSLEGAGVVGRRSTPTRRARSPCPRNTRACAPRQERLIGLGCYLLWDRKQNQRQAGARARRGQKGVSTKGTPRRGKTPPPSRRRPLARVPRCAPERARRFAVSVCTFFLPDRGERRRRRALLRARAPVCNGRGNVCVLFVCVRVGSGGQEEEEQKRARAPRARRPQGRRLGQKNLSLIIS